MILDELHTYLNAQPGLESLAIYKPDLTDSPGAPDLQLALRPTGGLAPIVTLSHGDPIVDSFAIQHLLRSNPAGDESVATSAYVDADQLINIVYLAVDGLRQKSDAARVLSGVQYRRITILQPPSPLQLPDTENRRLFSFNAVYERERP